MVVSKNKNDWIEYANKIKEIRSKLLEVICYRSIESDPRLVTNRELEYLRRSLNLIDEFKSKAEDRMYRVTKIEDSTIWYGTIKEKEKTTP